MFGFFDDHFLFFGLEIAYYGFIIAVAIAVGVFVACKNAKFRGLTSDDLIVAACYILPFAIIGARLYYVLCKLEEFSSFVEVLRIWDGGLAVYGSIIGGAIGLAIFCLIHKKNWLDVADVVVPSLLLGQAAGRIGCYFSGCCYGIDVTGTKYAWAPLSYQIDGRWHLATPFYESFWNLIGFIVLLIVLRKCKIKQRGVISACYLIYYGVGRAWIEALRGDSLYFGGSEQLLVEKVSFIVSLICIFLGIGILIFYFVKGKKVPQMGGAKTLREVEINSGETYLDAKQKKFKKKAKNIAAEEDKVVTESSLPENKPSDKENNTAKGG